MRRLLSRSLITDMAAWEPATRGAGAKRRYGDKPVIYPPMPDDMRTLEQPPGD